MSDRRLCTEEAVKAFRKFLAWSIFWFFVFDGLALAFAGLRFGDSISQAAFNSAIRVSDYSMIGIIVCVVAYASTHAKRIIDSI